METSASKYLNSPGTVTITRRMEHLFFSDLRWMCSKLHCRIGPQIAKEVSESRKKYKSDRSTLVLSPTLCMSSFLWTIPYASDVKHLIIFNLPKCSMYALMSKIEQCKSLVKISAFEPIITSDSEDSGYDSESSSGDSDDEISEFINYIESLNIEIDKSVYRILS